MDTMSEAQLDEYRCMSWNRENYGRERVECIRV